MYTQEQVKKAKQEFNKFINKHKELKLDTYNIYSGFDREALRAMLNEYSISSPLLENNLSTTCFYNYAHVFEHVDISMYEKESKRSISWEDSGKEPESEYLYIISYPTGAYIFGEHYPTKLFNKFFEELKSYNPDYIDSSNRNLYWELPNATKIHQNYPDIFEKYKNKANSEFAEKQKQINLLQKQIEEIKKQ